MGVVELRDQIAGRSGWLTDRLCPQRRMQCQALLETAIEGGRK